MERIIPRRRRIKFIRRKPSPSEIVSHINVLVNAVNVLNGHPSVDTGDGDAREQANKEIGP